MNIEPEIHSRDILKRKEAMVAGINQCLYLLVHNTEFLILNTEKQRTATWWNNVNPRHMGSRREVRHKNVWVWVVGKGSSCGNARCASFLEHLKLGQQTHRAGQWEHRAVPVDMVQGTGSPCFLSPVCQIKQVNPLANSFLLKDSTRFFPANSKIGCRPHGLLKVKMTFLEPKANRPVCSTFSK